MKLNILHGMHMQTEKGVLMSTEAR
jgi:hypothetical protein